MDLIKFFKKYLGNFSKGEAVFFSFSLLFTLFMSIFAGDPIYVIISAVCGLSYTILAGKGRILGYYIGIIGTLCYCYIAYKNGFYGNCLLYGCYYFPMEIIGIIKWGKNLKENTAEIIKTELNKKEKFIYALCSIILALILYIILKFKGGSSPFIDSITTIFSIMGFYLSVKRCMDQWYYWIIVNFLSTVMWVGALIKGFPCTGTVIMWGIYSFLGIYFLIAWKKDLKIA